MRRRSQVAGVERAAVDPTAVRVAEPSVVRTTAWPSNPVVSGGIWFCLTLSLYIPIGLARPPLVLAALAAVPTILSALTTKFLFEALVAPAGRESPRHWPIAAPISAAVGLGVVLLSATILGVHLTPGAVLTGAACLGATLPAAVGSRSLERRVGASNRRIFFIGSSEQAEDLAHEICWRGDMRLVGVAQPAAAWGGNSDLPDRITAVRTNILVVSAESVRDEHLVAVASKLNLGGLKVRDLNRFYDEQFAKVPLSELSPSWFLFDVAEIHRARFYGGAKRIVESAVAAAVLLVTLPIMPFVALAIRLSSPGPVFYRQDRVGKHGEHFALTKFRTMTMSTGGTQGWGTEHQDRITGVGRVLRRTRLDEVPQLAQVLLGKLSLVGPRPEQPAIVERLCDKMEFYAARHCVRPGLTGWAQVNYGYGGSDKGALEKLQYDFFYIRHQSLRLDLSILAATVRIVLMSRGV